jgi:hypothetical protein
MHEIVTPNKTKRPKIDADTIISTVLDMSGSMRSITLPTISGYDEYIGTQKEAVGAGKAVASLTVFNTDWLNRGSTSINIETLYRGLELERVEELTTNQYRPDGGTPLYDAIAHVVRDTEKLIERCKGTPDVFLVIITDGEENSSKEHTRDNISKLITEKQEDGWNFVFLGADQNAWEVGTGLGIHGGNTHTYAKANIQQDVFGNVARGSTQHRVMSHSLKARGLVAEGARYSTADFFGDTSDVVESAQAESSSEEGETTNNRSQPGTE